MAAFTSIASGNWNDGPTTWGTLAGVYPGSAGTGDTVTITASSNVNLNVDPPNSIASIASGDATSYITVDSTRVLTVTASGTAITASGANTGGFIRVGTGGNLRIIHDVGGSSITVLQQTAAGYAILQSGTGIVRIDNTGGTALRCTVASGRGLSNTSGSGVLDINGNISNTAGSAITTATCTSTITIDGDVTGSGSSCLTFGFSAGGNVTITGDMTTATAATQLLSISGGTATLSGAAYNTAEATANLISISSSGTFTWIGTESNPSNGILRIIATGTCTINLATAGGALALANSGVFVLDAAAGTLNVTSGANNFLCSNQSAASYAVILGASSTARAKITGASIPSAADTRYGVTRGWADGGTDATAGCGVAGGNGLLEIPNEGAATGTEDATSDALVKDGCWYGSTPREGTYVGGGGGGRKLLGALRGT